MLRKIILVMTFLSILLTMAYSQEAKIDKDAPDFKLQDINGMEVILSDYFGKVIVLEWINFDCPFVKKHYESGNLPKLQAEYKDKGVVWFAICSSAPGKEGNLPKGEIRKRLSQYNSKILFYLIDEDGKVGKMYGAKTTPHIFIIDKNGKLVYSGAVDDKPSTKVEDIEKSKNYVREVVDALLAGKVPTIKTTKPYGCSVKYK
ncbi:MAG: thioredoxin family protein [Ignavibacteria bacterium]|nr:thioredoxin family protein [Ignavibacteria bacterium]